MTLSSMLKNGMPWLTSVVVTCLLLSACSEPPAPPPEPADPESELEQPSPEDSNAMRLAVVDWLECDECEEGQLERVVEYGEQVTALLIGSLRDGAAPASTELYRRELERRHDDLVAYSRDHPNAAPTVPKDEFVEHYLARHDALVRTRAAEALGEIGGPDALAALEAAAKSDQSDDVAEVIQRAMDEAR